MNILSLFDGMSCGQIALNNLGYKVKYYASENDKYAIQVTQKNFPDTIQLGDINNWREWDIDWKSINLVLAGSPCQGFSFAGKQLAFDDPRSKLFFVFVEILNHIKKLNPDVKFLLENVQMKKEHLRIMSEYVGIFPCNINSNLVSAQNRNRWYWSNIRTKKIGLFDELYTDIPQPKDRGIYLKDILQPESEIDKKYYIKNPKIGFEDMDINGKNNALRTGGKQSQTKKHNFDIVCVAMRGCESTCLTPRRTEYGKEIRKDYESGKIKEQRKNIQQLEPREDGKTNTISTVQKDNLILTKNYIQENSNKKHSQENRYYFEESKSPSLGVGHAMSNPQIIQRARGFNKGGQHTDKCPTLTSNSWDQNNTLQQDYRLRRLTPIECERLQTVPDNYTSCVSDTQRYKMLGNGFTDEVIEHILSYFNQRS